MVADPTPAVERALNFPLPTVTSWEQWSRIFTDVATWAPAIREIGRRAGLPVTTVKAGYPGTNAVFIVDADSGDPTYVVKIYCPFCREDFTLERILHPLLMRYPDLPVPVSIGHGILKGEMDWPYLILSFLPGDAIRDVRPVIPRANLISIARELGHCVKVLHRIPQSSRLPLEPLLGEWEILAEQLLVKTLDDLTAKRILSPELIRKIPDLVDSTLEDQAPSEPVLVNGDLTEDHVLVQERDGTWHMSGLIDFADSLIAPRDYEWLALWFGALDQDPVALRAFLHGYKADFPIDETFRRRAMVFTFLHEFGAFMIEMALRKLGAPDVKSLKHLETLLWSL